MPWSTSEFKLLVNKAKDLVEKEFGVRATAKVSICTLDEIQKVTLKEFYKRGLNASEIDYFLKTSLPYLDGKFFLLSNQILVVEGRGTNLSTIFHELLHSIQRCFQHREGIVYYLTYRLLKGKAPIKPGLLSEWQAIEKRQRLPVLKKRLVSEGDCEDF